MVVRLCDRRPAGSRSARARSAAPEYQQQVQEDRAEGMTPMPVAPSPMDSVPTGEPSTFATVTGLPVFYWVKSEDPRGVEIGRGCWIRLQRGRLRGLPRHGITPWRLG